MKTKENNHEVVNRLNLLLSDLQIVYQNLRTVHWLVKGHEFFMLHKLYEEYYTEMAEGIDEVAERVLMLEGTPLFQFSDYLKHASVKPLAEVPKGKESLKVVVENYTLLLGSYRSLLALAADHNDEGTVAMMSEWIGSTEKKLWMLKATLA